MIYLITAIICSGMLAISMRLAEDKGCNMKVITMLNYVFALVFSFVLLDDKGILLNAGDAKLEMAFGIINGFLFLATLVIYQWNLKNNGVPLSVSFSRLGVLIPILVSMLFFGDLPEQLQWVGLGLALVAMILINYTPNADMSMAKNKVGLIILFVAGGAADVLTKIFDIYGNHELSDFYIFYTFLVALILSVVVLLISNKKDKVKSDILEKVSMGNNDMSPVAESEVNLTEKASKKKEIVFGLAVGFFNYFSSILLVYSVINLPAFVVFPVFSVGVIVFANIVNFLFFKEKLGKQQYAGMVIIAIALVCLNM